MNDRYAGIVTFDIAGQRSVLRYDWQALARLRTEFGKDYNEVVGRACQEGDPDVLARALACGLVPAVGAEEVLKASPAMLKVTSAIDLALKYAYFGAEEVPDIGEDPTQRPRGTLLRRLFGGLFGRESSRASSGS